MHACVRACVDGLLCWPCLAGICNPHHAWRVHGPSCAENGWILPAPGTQAQRKQPYTCIHVHAADACEEPQWVVQYAAFIHADMPARTCSGVMPASSPSPPSSACTAPSLCACVRCSRASAAASASACSRRNSSSTSCAGHAVQVLSAGPCMQQTRCTGVLQCMPAWGVQVHAVQQRIHACMDCARAVRTSYSLMSACPRARDAALLAPGAAGPSPSAPPSSSSSSSSPPPDSPPISSSSYCSTSASKWSSIAPKPCMHAAARTCSGSMHMRRGTAEARVHAWDAWDGMQAGRQVACTMGVRAAWKLPS